MADEGHYLAWPAAYEHLPAPPAWLMDNDGFFDTRMMHSRDGATRWGYVGGGPGEQKPRRVTCL